MKKARQNFVAVLLLCMGCWLNVSAGNLVVGDYGGEAGVSPSGAAVYTIPVECPKGVNGMEPVVALAYNSQSGMGNAGWGWNLSATSVIMKTCATPYYDGKVLPISDVSTDYLVLDGQRLIKYKDLGNDETEFRTENDHYDRIIRKGKSLDYTFTVYTTSGRKMTYSQLKEGSSWYHGNLGWYLTEVEDLWGNYMTYEYDVSSDDETRNISSVQLSSIQYGGNKKAETVHTCEVKFAFATSIYSLMIPMTYYIDGFKKTRWTYLSSIETYSGGQLYRRYSLTYQNDTELYRKYLSKFTVYGNNGDYLKSLEITWNEIAKTLTERKIMDDFPNTVNVGDVVTADYLPGTCLSQAPIAVDYDEDGYTDLIIEKHMESLGGRSSSNPYYSTYLLYYHNEAGTLRYERLERIPKKRGRDFAKSIYGRALLCNWSKRTKRSTIIPYINFDTGKTLYLQDITMGETVEVQLSRKQTGLPYVACADFDKDGFEDVVVAENCDSIRTVRIHIVWGGSSSQKQMTELIYYDLEKAIGIGVSDINCDGLMDITVVTSGTIHSIFNEGCLSQEITPTFRNKGFRNPNVKDSETYAVEISDFNGDGLTDLYLSGSKGTSLCIGSGDGTFKVKTVSDAVLSWNKDYSFSYDYDNDGSSELGIFKNKEGRFIIYKLYANQFVPHYSSSITPFIGKGITMGDFNGDGRMELLSMYHSVISRETEQGIFYLSDLSSDNSGGLVGSIKTPLHDITFDYGLLTDVAIYSRRKTMGDNSCVKNTCLPMYVVKKIVCDDVSSEYFYEDALFQITGKGFLGFGGTKVKNRGITYTTNNKFDDKHSVIYPYITMEETGGVESKKTTKTYSFHHSYENSKFFDLRLTKEVVFDGLNDLTRTTTFSSYERNFPRKIVLSLGGVVSQTTEYKVIVDSTYNMVLPKQNKETWTDQNGSEYSLSTTDYNAYFTPRKKIALKGTDLAVTTQYTYDKFGNPLTSKITAEGCESRTEKYTYTTSGRFLKSITSPNGESTTFTVDEKYGWMTKKVRKSGDDSYTTKYVQYDGFGNCLKTNLPDGRTALWSSSYAPSNCLLGEVYMITKTLEGTPTKTDAFDRNGQVVLHSETDADGKVRKIHYKYDSYGRLVCERQPFTSGTPNDYSRRTYSYDSFGRLLKIGEYRSDNVTSYSYSKRKVQIVSPIGTTVREYDVAGRMVKTTENGKSVSFTYYPSGKMKSSKAGQHVVSMTYDAAGNRTCLSDPDVGTIQSEYDAYGREVLHTTEEGDVIEYSYNEKGLLSGYTDGQNATFYSYGKDNLLVSEFNSAYSCDYSYDKFKRPVSIKETMDGKSFLTSYSYDKNYGDVSTTVYPSGLSVKNEYDSYGHLISVKCGESEIWKMSSLDEKGRLTKEILAGDVVKIHTYNVDGELTSESAYRGETGLMDISYAYSAWKITKKTDNLTSNEEAYTYDKLGRLSHVKSTNVVQSLSKEGDVKYDSDNNMTSIYDNLWNDITYNPDSIPHQAIGAVFVKPCTSDAKNIKKDAYRMITEIKAGSLKYVYTYRPDHRHCMRKNYKSDKPQGVKYYLGDYEKEVNKDGKSREIHYLCGGSGLAAIYVRNDGKDTLFTAVTDRQNSLTAVMDVATKKVEKLSYKPWGMRRYATDWTKDVVKDCSKRFSRGYCMHEHVPELNILDMGGRMFDLRTCQFLTPDPYMQAPESWLNHNRYAYCLHNPVMYTDPDGEWIHIAIGALIGGTINLIANSDNCQGFWQGFTSFAVGAGAGASVAATFGASLGVFLGVSAASSAVTMATNNVVAQTGENFSGMNQVNWGSVGTSAAIGLGTGLVSSLAGYGACQFAGKFMVGGMSIKSPAVKGIITGAIGGAGGGYASGFAMSMMTTGDLEAAREAGFHGMWKGALLGAGSGLAGSAIWARKNGVNAWTGEKLVKPANGPDNLVADEGGSYSVYQGFDKETGELKYVGITKRDPQIRFLEHLRSNTPRADLDYRVMTTGLSRTNARILEQTLINQMGGPGNYNYNKINSIAPRYWNRYNIPPILLK